MRFHLTNAPLFSRHDPKEESDALLSCLNAKARACKKGEIILMEGAPTEQLAWFSRAGSSLKCERRLGQQQRVEAAFPRRNLRRSVCLHPGEPLMVNVVAAEDSTVLLLNARQVLTPVPMPAPATRG